MGKPWDDDTVFCDGKIVAMTDDAVLIDFSEIDGTSCSDEPEWIPRSQIVTGPEYRKGEEGEFEIMQWLLEKRGLL